LLLVDWCRLTTNGESAATAAAILLAELSQVIRRQADTITQKDSINDGHRTNTSGSGYYGYIKVNIILTWWHFVSEINTLYHTHTHTHTHNINKKSYCTMMTDILWPFLSTW